MATIRVKLTPATRKKMAAPRNTKKDPDPIREIKLPGDDPISEKQKKGGAHVSGCVSVLCCNHHPSKVVHHSNFDNFLVRLALVNRYRSREVNEKRDFG